ncbi:hypothetical protein [Nocardia camponoti]|uniref:Acid stress chaperone HdeA n=1 Tax=Nocardia camponoti TaxID=1616106 RepID=A0A917V4D8_9NOCA|nr:hypothetical protein [Nocardia camponoti]GGK35665.1 hypothetical protein GCM10011591_04140 [Nocardia camponoti]
MAATARRISVITAGLAALTLATSACTEVAQALNQGGDTPCRDYVNQDNDTKRVTVTKAVKQKTGTSNEPSGTLVDSVMVQLDVLCAGQRNPDTPIKNADIAGLLIPR